MSVTSKLLEAIAELRSSEGVDLPSPDVDGAAAFAVTHEGQTTNIYLRAFEQGDMVSLLCPLEVPDVPARGRDKFYQGLLAATCLGLETNGLALSLNPSDGRLCLGYSIYGKLLDAEALGEVIGRLVVAARAWRDKFAGRG